MGKAKIQYFFDNISHEKNSKQQQLNWIFDDFNGLSAVESAVFNGFSAIESAVFNSLLWELENGQKDALKGTKRGLEKITKEIRKLSLSFIKKSDQYNSAKKVQKETLWLVFEGPNMPKKV